MKQIVVSFLIILVGLVFFGGCTRIVDWGRSSFYQGDNIILSQAPESYIRSVVMYDQLRTVAIFDALWLSDAVRSAYADSYALKRGRSLEQKQLFLRRQLEENNHFISFYVLSNHGAPLGQPDGNWHLLLEIDGAMYAPIEIKQVDLMPEYKVFFGKKCNRFKTPYLVKFPVKDVDDNFLINQDTAHLTLHFRSVKKHTALRWTLL